MFQSESELVECGQSFGIYSTISKNRCFAIYKAIESQMCDLVHENSIYYSSLLDIFNKV